MRRRVICSGTSELRRSRRSTGGCTTGMVIFCPASGRTSTTRTLASTANALSHIDSFADLLAHGAWCDEIAMPPKFVDDHDADKLLRFYSLAWLMLSECLADLRSIAHAVSRSTRLLPEADQLMGFINAVWKHRNRGQGEQQPFHRHHHHGPYLFADAGRYKSALPQDRSYVALGHVPPGGEGPAPLVVPSLISAVGTVGDQVRALDLLLDRPEAREKLEVSWSTAEVPGWLNTTRRMKSVLRLGGRGPDVDLWHATGGRTVLGPRYRIGNLQHWTLVPRTSSDRVPWTWVISRPIGRIVEVASAPISSPKHSGRSCRDGEQGRLT